MLHRVQHRHDSMSANVFARTFVTVLAVVVVCPLLSGWDLPFLSHRQRGERDFRAGRYQEASEHFRRAIEVEGNDWKLLYNLGTSYYRQGKWENAIEELSYASQIAETDKASNSERARILHNLGLSYLQNDDCGNALSALEQAAQLEPADQDISRNLEFAKEYCAGQGGQSQTGQQSEQQQESQQSSEGQQSGQGQSGEEQQGGGQSQQSQEETQEQSSQGEQQGEGTEQQETETEGAGEEQDEEGQGQEEKENSEQGNNSENLSEGGSRDDVRRGGGGQEVPDDGLKLSDAQVEEILRYMSRLERDRAGRYFWGGPTEGDYLDDETIMDLFRRLFLGIPDEDRAPEPEDGIDW